MAGGPGPEAAGKDPAGIARDAARCLAAEVDPGLPGCVEKALGDAARHPEGAADGVGLGPFLVVCAQVGCRLHAELLEKTARPARVYLERRLRNAMGIDEGMSHDHDVIIEFVADALLRADPPASV